MNDYYLELVINDSINTLNEAMIFKLSYEKAFYLNGVGCSSADKEKQAFDDGYELGCNETANEIISTV
jgi:hypothetical protein